MAQLPCQDALARVLAYLRGSGISPGVEECRIALKLVDQVLQQSPNSDYLQTTMELLPQYFELPAVKETLTAAPDLARGSMGYD